MLKKFLSLFTRWKSRDCGDTPASWPDLVGQPRRVQAASDAPFETGTPHSRMHGLIVSGKPDALIAIELGVEISAVRTYRHIISARAREVARRRAIEAGLQAGTLVLRSPRGASQERVPAALLRQYKKPTGAQTTSELLVERVLINESFGKYGALNYGQFGYPGTETSSAPDSFSSAQGGDFGGGGASESFRND
jgi:hypothetical protein